MNFFKYLTLFLFFLSNTVYSDELRSSKDTLLNIINYDLKSLEKDMAILDEVHEINTMIFRSAGNDIFSNHSDSIVYIQTDIALGSGVVINDDGEIITNAHVIEDAQEIFVIFKPKSGNNVQVSAIHESSLIKKDIGRDLALIKPLYPPTNINIIDISKSMSFENDYVATTAHCIGHPDGYAWTYTGGVISAYRKNFSWPSEDGLMRTANVVQIDCSINPGNSGGALISDDGELIGINTFKDPANDDINFAVAANEVLNFIESNEFAEPETIENIRKRIEGDPIFVSGKDFNNDGLYEIESWDFDKNGIIDTYVHYEDEDDKWEKIEKDENENNVIDSVIIANKDGSISHFFDVDEDGVNDYQWIDTDQDGQFEVKQKI